MKKRLAVLKLVGIEAGQFGVAALAAELKKLKGVPDGAKELRRYRDVSYGLESVGIVFEHPSFAEVEDGGQIPVIKQVAPAKAPSAVPPVVPPPVPPVVPPPQEPQDDPESPESSEEQEPAKRSGKAGKNK
ncbi:MAG: hypothetical protein ABFD89_29150 [Bryobacteraceae bacterium]